MFARIDKNMVCSSMGVGRGCRGGLDPNKLLKFNIFYPFFCRKMFFFCVGKMKFHHGCPPRKNDFAHHLEKSTVGPLEKILPPHMSNGPLNFRKRRRKFVSKTVNEKFDTYIINVRDDRFHELEKSLPHVGIERGVEHDIRRGEYELALEEGRGLLVIV